jgi:predicted RNA-binding protein YlxR (DUF448 family)
MDMPGCIMDERERKINRGAYITQQHEEVAAKMGSK